MISKNVNGFQSTKKRLKILQYFKNKLLLRGISFLREIHSTKTNEASWRDESDVLFFSFYGLSNFYGVFITSCRQHDINVLNQMSDKWPYTDLNVTIDDENFVLINFHNVNTENEKV